MVEAVQFVGLALLSAAVVAGLLGVALNVLIRWSWRRQIAAEFAAMVGDADYLKETKLLEEEFEHSDWEALRLGEEDIGGSRSMPEVLRGDVFTVSLEPVQGSEQGGARPVVVVSRDAVNKFSPVVVVCPITNAENKSRIYPSHVRVASRNGWPQARFDCRMRANSGNQ